MLQGNADLATLLVTFDGVALPRGYAEGDALSIEYNADVYNDTVGPDGDLHRARSLDKTGTLTIRAKNTSIALRAFLDGVLRRHDAGVTAASLVRVTMLSTGESYTLSGVFPKTRPTITFTNEPTDREYAFRAAEITEGI